jgi:hypothetical protein
MQTTMKGERTAVADQKRQERQEKMDQQRMDNESPAAKDSPLPGEHFPDRAPLQWSPRFGSIPRVIEVCRGITGAKARLQGAGRA